MAIYPVVTARDNPLTAPPPAEVPLPRAPLVRVIAQVRFPLIISIERREFIAPLQEVLRASYPVLRSEQTQELAVNLRGPTPPAAQTVWRFSDVEGHWRVSLAPEFIALETTAYTRRTDFMSRLRDVVQALHEHVGLKVVDRLGLRYIDRVEGPDFKDIAQLVRSEMLGIATTPLAAHVRHSLCETLLELKGASLLARWGNLPPDATVDPAAIEPIQVPSWILDLDMFSAESFDFELEPLMDRAHSHAERLYTFFRWAVTEEFLRRYGGNA